METLNNKVTGGNLTAAEWNQIPSELQNVITQTGQSLTNADLNQLGKGIQEYVSNGTFYIDSGGVNAPVLSPIGSKQGPIAYTDGMEIRFLLGVANTSSINVNVNSLGVKDFVNFNGNEFVSGDLFTDEIQRAVFDTGTDRFLLTPEINQSTYSTLKSGRKNFIINGSFEIFQRGTSFVSAASIYTADRWLTVATNSDRTNTNIAPTANLGLALTQNGASLITLLHGIELGIFASAGEFSVGSVFIFSFTAHTTTPQNLNVFGNFRDNVASGTNNVVAFTTVTVSATSTVTRLSITATISGSPGATNKILELGINDASGGSLTNLTISQMQFERGNQITDFEYSSIGETFQLCERYFQKSYDDFIAPGTATTDGAIVFLPPQVATSQPFIRFTQRTRTTSPTMTFFTSSTGASGFIRDVTGGSDQAVILGSVDQTGFLVAKSAAYIVGNTYRIQWSADDEL